MYTLGTLEVYVLMIVYSCLLVQTSDIETLREIDEANADSTRLNATAILFFSCLFYTNVIRNFQTNMKR